MTAPAPITEPHAARWAGSAHRVAKETVDYSFELFDASYRAWLPAWFDGLAGALAPGGRLLVETFNGAGISGAWPWMNDQYIQTIFTEHSLRYAVEGAGLEVEHLGGVRPPAKGLRRALRMAAMRAWQSCLKLAYVLERGIDSQNPTILDKSILLVASKAVGD